MKVAVCLKGTEDIIAKDLNGEKLIDGRVIFDESKNVGGVNKIYSLIDNFKFKDYNNLIEKISKLKFKFKGSFRVDCDRAGEHDFDSSMIERGVGEIIYKKGFKVDLKEPKNRILVDIINKDCLVGFLEKDKLCKRDYRVRISNQGLNACLAYCMLKILGKGDLIDPFCRDGVIAIEAAKLKLGRVYAWDSNENNLKNTKTNAQLAGVKLNFTSLEKVKNINVATFLPVVTERSKWREEEIKKFFDGVKAKRMVLCTLNEEIIKKHAKNLKSEREIIVGDFKYKILVLGN